jgi:hypothetical protein
MKNNSYLYRNKRIYIRYSREFKMFDENMQPVIDKSDRHVGQISSNLSWQKTDCGMNDME